MHVITSVLKKIPITSKGLFTKKLKVAHCNCRFYNDITSDGMTELVTLGVIKRTLKSKQVKTEDGHACLTIDCPMCAPTQSPTNAKPQRLYINKTTGAK